MPGGARKKPVALKILRMSGAKAEKLLKTVSPCPGPIGEPPDWLTAPQKEDWAFCIENAPKDVLKRIDKALLTAYIVTADQYRRAVRRVEAEGMVKESPRAQMKVPNPYLTIANRQMVLMLRAAGEMGFTPVSRARIDAGKPPATDGGGAWQDIDTDPAG